MLQVVLADPKDRNKDIVVFLAAEHQADAPDEAEQRAAVTALHRVAGDRALHRVLPEAYLPLWQELCATVSPPIGSLHLQGGSSLAVPSTWNPWRKSELSKEVDQPSELSCQSLNATFGNLLHAPQSNLPCMVVFAMLLLQC